jgi:hypothetical protein
MTFEIVCECSNRWSAKSIHQAEMLKHTHMSYQENHEVDIRDENGGLVKIE